VGNLPSGPVKTGVIILALVSLLFVVISLVLLTTAAHGIPRKRAIRSLKQDNFFSQNEQQQATEVVTQLRFGMLAALCALLVAVGLVVLVWYQ